MFQAWWFNPESRIADHVENYDTLEEAIQDQLRLWHESDDICRMCFIKEGFHVKATLFSSGNPEFVTVATEINHRRFRVRYIVDEQGHYVQTHIDEI